MAAMPDQASRWFRAVALLLIPALAVPQTAELIAGSAPLLHARPLAALALGAFALALAAGFGWAFWRITGLRPGHTPRWVHGLVALQAFVSFTMTVDLLPLVTAEIGYMLPSRLAWRWYGVLAILLMGTGATAQRDGSFAPTSGLGHLPLWAQVGATLVQMAAWTLFSFVLGRFLAAERQEREECARMNGELIATRDLLAQTSRTGERLRIARELHDTLGHQLTAMAVNLDLAARVDGPRARQAIERSHLLSKLLLNDVRDAVVVMRQEPAIDLDGALRALAANVPSHQVHLELKADVKLDGQRAHALFRSAQEGLTNAVRHARARQVWISLDHGAGEVVLTVRDDGRGPGTVAPGNGLRGMQERLEALGGRLEYGCGPGIGFELRAVLPLERPA